jgi:hypothetical protein
MPCIDMDKVLWSVSRPSLQLPALPGAVQAMTPAEVAEVSESEVGVAVSIEISEHALSVATCKASMLLSVIPWDPLEQKRQSCR